MAFRDPTIAAISYIQGEHGRCPTWLSTLARIQSSPDKCSYDMYDWHGNRTRMVAHEYIMKHWPELRSGDVIDVEFILGESATPKQSERVEAPL